MSSRKEKPQIDPFIEMVFIIPMVVGVCAVLAVENWSDEARKARCLDYEEQMEQLLERKPADAALLNVIQANFNQYKADCGVRS